MNTVNILDDPDAIIQVDKERMLPVIKNWPEMLQEVYKKGKKVTLSNTEEVKTIIFTGMGGSAISGNVIADIFGTQSRKRFVVLRSYDLPNWIEPEESLIIAISYSGNTEETLSATYQALKRDIPTAFITSNGILLKQATRRGLPHVKLKEGLQPRAAFPMIFGAIFGLLMSNGILLDDREALELDWKETLTTINATVKLNQENHPLEKNEAKQVATKILKTLPVIFTSYESLGLRWRAQLNENAKILAQEMIFPEMCHNHIEAFEHLLPSMNIKGLQLLTGTENSILKQRMKITTEIIEEHCHVEFHTIHGKGASTMAKFLSLILIGDYVSVYLSILRKVNPTPVVLIERLKKELEEKTTFKKGLIHQYNEM